MTGVTSDLALSSEVSFVDRVHHADHSPRGLLAWVVVGVFLPVATALGAMAIGAGLTQGSGEESHGGHELVHRNAFEHADVFEGLLRHRCLLLWRGGGV